jgi:hypothetical protein
MFLRFFMMMFFMLKKNLILNTFFFCFRNYQDNMTSETHTLPTSSTKRPHFISQINLIHFNFVIR